MPVRTSSVPVAREQQSSAYDREKEQRERRDREKEREYRERERERAKPKEANGPSPTAVATQKKKQEQRISTMTEAQIMEKLRKCRQVQLDMYGSRVVNNFWFQVLLLALVIPMNPSRDSRELVKGTYDICKKGSIKRHQ